MRNLLARLVLLFCICSAQAATKYIAREAYGGAGNGTSWANAWTNVDKVVWSGLSAGDTVWISGGPLGGTNIYHGNLTDQSGSPVDATLGNPITFKASQEEGRNGLVLIQGGIFMSRNYYVLDGSKSDWVPVSTMDTLKVLTNCNLEVSQTNSSQAVQVFGTGTKVKAIHVSLNTSYDDSGVYYSATPGRPCGNGAEIAYCWIENINGFGVRAEINDWIADTYGQLNVHHCYMENIHDNFMQLASHSDFHHNVCHTHLAPEAGHPDCVQEVDKWSRVWNNIFWNHRGARFYVEANSPLTHDVLAYGNLYYSTTNWYSTGEPNNPGTGFDITGHDAGAGTECNLSNIWYFNNTLQQRGTLGSPAAFIWSSGTPSNQRLTSSWVTNFYVYNNNVIGVSPYNTDVMMQFPTNIDYAQGYNGWTYTEPCVKVDYNSVNGASGNGRGIVYGTHGSTLGNNLYQTMAAFAADTAYKSNNNNTASYVSLSGYDYRPQTGDTALVARGTNLHTALASIAPDIDQDLYGLTRPTNWSIGAFEIPAGYWVSTNGNDGAAGTFAAPWRTIQHAANVMTAGNTVNVTPGDYGEYVDTVASGSAGSRIIFRAYPSNDPNNPVVSHCFRVKHRFITIEGFKLRKATGLNGSMIRIESPSSGGNNGSDCIVTNNTICDGVMLITRTASFGSDYMHITSAYEGGTNFLDAGFVAGMGVYIGSDSLYPHTNTGSVKTVASVSGDGMTIYFTTGLSTDTGTNYWVPIVAGGDGPTSWRGLMTVPRNSGQEAVSNVVVTCNTFSNLIGVAIDIARGEGTNQVTYNKILRGHGGYAMRLYASNLEVAYNLIKDNIGIITFVGNELTDPSLHPSGGQYYDWQCNLTTSGLTTNQHNINYHHNWIQNCENQLGEIDYAPDNGPWTIRNCVYVGCSGHGSASLNDITIDHCTFYKNVTEGTANLTWAIGSSTVNFPQTLNTNLTIISNIVSSSGSHYNLSQEAPWGLSNLTNYFFSNTFSVFNETMDFTNTPLLAAPWTNGTFGTGDPLFVNPSDPLGPDGLPFTDDDGLRPLASGVPGSLGLGALTPIGTNAPVAHFRVILSVPGWKDATGTNYDPAFAALKPHERTHLMRPWQTPEALGSSSNTPVTVIFNASQSLDGLSLTNTSISSYTWTFNGGATTTLATPTITNTFSTPGTNSVSLTITNNQGTSSTYTNSYRLLGDYGGADSTPPVISGISVYPSINTCTVTWNTDESATSGLEWGTTGSYGSSSTNATPGTSHSLNATSLNASTLYHYRVHSTDGSGNHAQSNDATFTTTSSSGTTGKTIGSGTLGGGTYQ